MPFDDSEHLHDLMRVILEARIGHAPMPWPGTLRHALERLAAQRRRDPASVLRELAANPRHPAADALVTAATVGYTSFFRHRAQLERLAAALRDRDAEARIWVAGCSTGEEAYSIAIIAERARCPVRIVATDVDEQALGIARGGRYPRADAERAGLAAGRDGWEAPASLREPIRFVRASVFDADPCGAEGPFDFIFFRNVLIYFEPEAGAGVLEEMSRRLAPGGMLVVAPVDALRPIPERLRRGEPLGWLEPCPPRAPSVPPLPPQPAPRAEAGSWVLERAARALGLGELDEAESTLRTLLSIEPVSPEAWFLLAEVLSKRGEIVQARVAFEAAARHAPSTPEGETLARAARRRLSG